MNEIEIKSVPGKGRGVFALKEFVPGEIIEICPVLELSAIDASICQKTILNNYLFDWYDRYNSAIVLGYGSLYNHSYTPNCQYIFHEDQQSLEVIALTSIQKGEEISFNYNGDPADISLISDMDDVLTGKKLVIL